MSSHKGGVWERQIRTIRKILMKVIEGQNFNYDLLATFLVQCEATVNQRPLVRATDDPTDDTTLRPCDLLLLHQKRPIPILGIKVESYRKNWKQCQHVVE